MEPSPPPMSWRDHVDATYDDEIEQFYEQAIDAVLDESLGPRGPEMLFELATALLPGPSRRVLDVGSRDGRHLVELTQRLGGPVVGVEPAPGNLARQRRSQMVEPLLVARGLAEALPFAPSTFDLVWIRDVLVHVASLRTALAEVRRVVQPSGAVLIYHVVATPLMGCQDATELLGPAAIVAENIDEATFHLAIVASGLVVEQRIDVAGEWVEYAEEQRGTLSRQLLRVARMRRDPERYRALIGERAYTVEMGNCLFGLYQLLGKLSSVVYVLRRG